MALLTVSSSVHSQVLLWAHAFRWSSHPGVRRTIKFLQRHFWWPSMEADTWGFISACSICSHGKASHHPSVSPLRPLPVPGRPWSHIALDFIMGLPMSEGNSVILTTVDRFSKAVHFVPKLPSASKTTQLMVNHIFQLHGVPLDIVSDRGPQFTASGKPSARH